jgi:hypothetical protein
VVLGYRFMGEHLEAIASESHVIVTWLLDTQRIESDVKHSSHALRALTIIPRHIRQDVSRAVEFSNRLCLAQRRISGT